MSKNNAVLDRPITRATYLLVESYWRVNGYNARQIAYEIKRDVAVADKILADIKSGKRY